MVIKIAFTGPASSGKTTICNSLYEYLKNKGYNVLYVNNITRDYINSNNIDLNIITEHDAVKIQKDIADMYIKLHNRDYSSYDYVLFDRTVYDQYVYSILTLNNNNLINHIKNTFNGCINTKYDHIIYTIYGKFTNDGCRTIKYKNKGENELFELICKPRANLVLDWVDVPSRLQIITNYLKV